MLNQRRTRIVSGFCALLLIGFGGTFFALTQANEDSQADAEGAGEAAAAPVIPVHNDAAAATKGLMETVRAFMYRDAEHLADSLELLTANVRSLKREESDVYGGIVGFSNSFEMTGFNAKEFAGQGDLKNAYDQFHWMQRACISCHAAAEEKGLMPTPGLKPAR